MIRITCTGCGKVLSLADHVAGKRFRCKCGAIERIPAAETEWPPQMVAVEIPAPAEEPIVLELAPEPSPFEDLHVAEPVVVRRSRRPPDEDDYRTVDTREERAFIGRGQMWGRVSSSHIDIAERELLLPGELLLAIAKGRVKETSSRADGNFSLFSSGTSKGGEFLTNYVIVTTRRVILWARGVFKASTDAFELEDIRSVEIQQGMLSGAIRLNVAGRMENIADMHKEEADLVGNLIRDKVTEARRPPATPPPLPPVQVFHVAQQQVSPSADPIEQLERLGRLLEKGLISREEFESQKRRLL